MVPAPMPRHRTTILLKIGGLAVRLESILLLGFLLSIGAVVLGLVLAALAIFALCISFLIGCVTSPILGMWLLNVLSRRFSPPLKLPQHVDGIMVLAGATSRLSTFQQLTHQYPSAKRVFIGGAGAQWRGGPHSKGEAERVLRDLGIPPSTVMFETQSRNTHENAVASWQLLKTEAPGTWILITCPWHLPRAVGCFRMAGWNVLPYPAPTDYTEKTSASAKYDILQKVIKEWLALIVYRLMGYTDQLVPGSRVPDTTSWTDRNR
jgi:uncharacterized SAM-binding protein YcdF (DUF218 family)